MSWIVEEWSTAERREDACPALHDPGRSEHPAVKTSEADLATQGIDTDQSELRAPERSVQIHATTVTEVFGLQASFGQSVGTDQ